ncbi:MAG: glycogen debranching protein GlgX [Bacteroidota bacterium]
MKRGKIIKSIGTPEPLGATIIKNGVNFSVFSQNAKSVELLLFDDKDDIEPTYTIALSPEENKSYYYWHIHIEDIGAGQYYAYRIDGEYNPSKALAFDKSKILIDPYAKGIYAMDYDRMKAEKYGVDNIANGYKSVVVNSSDYDWEDDSHPKTDLSDLVIYEMHIGGFTKSRSSGLDESIRGTYAGLIEKIPYLKSLGINAVELMPVFAFDEQDAPVNKSNYWGYSPINFFAIHNTYSTEKEPIEAIREFKDMVKALHKEGIEVILDVVYNHTAESNYGGPLLCMKGFENEAYYILDSVDKAKYLDFTGCGNTFNANHSISRRMIIDSLNYWVKEMHVDGFRFDLASVLSRSEFGEPIVNPPIIWSIESEPTLACTKLIAEAWDASGLYQLGIFTGDKWAEWNGKYRDDIRRYVKGEGGIVSTIASRIVGSPDIFKKSTYKVSKSIHFITCHDGFTMNDLVSYNQKHNAANGESNLDGANDNHSWNCGVEGKTNDKSIEYLRLKQIKNFFAISFFSQGTPMILMGDEVRRTKNGNNNSYCLDSEINWFDWNLIENNTELLNFVRSLVSITQEFKVLRYSKNMDTVASEDGCPVISWHGTKVNEPDWSENSHSLGFEYHYPKRKERILVFMNMFWEDLEFEIPEAIYGKWNLQVDTSQDNSDTCTLFDNKKSIMVENRSIVVLIDK